MAFTHLSVLLPNLTDNKKLISLYFLYFISTITFGIFYSSLSLLLIQKFYLSPMKAIGLSGMFFAFHYSLGIIGGKIGDRYIDFKKLFISGKIFQLLSSITLLFALNHHNYKLLFLGLGFFLIDSMVSTISLNMFITNLFKKTNLQGRLVAFLNTHIWANVGFITAFLISGIIYYLSSIDKLLYITATLSFFVLISSIYIVPTSTQYLKSRLSYLKAALVMLLISFFITIILSNLNLSRGLIFTIAMGLLIIFLARSLSQLEKNDITNIIAFFAYMFCSLAFWSIYMLGPTFLPFFIDNNVDKVILGIRVPPQWIQITGPLTVVLAGSFLKKIFNLYLVKKDLQFSRKLSFVLGLTCSLSALLIIIEGLYISGESSQLNYPWILMYIFMMGVGEILIAPASKALVGDLIPKKFQGFCLGISQMVLGVSVIISGLISEVYLTQGNNLVNITRNSAYINIFGSLILIVLGTILLLLLFDRFQIKRDNLLSN